MPITYLVGGCMYKHDVDKIQKNTVDDCYAWIEGTLPFLDELYLIIQSQIELGTVSGDKYRRYVESISQFIEAGKKLLQNKE